MVKVLYFAFNRFNYLSCNDNNLNVDYDGISGDIPAGILKIRSTSRKTSLSRLNFFVICYNTLEMTPYLKRYIYIVTTIIEFVYIVMSLWGIMKGV